MIPTPVLLKRKRNDYSDNNKKFVSEAVDFLFDIGWIIQDMNGDYRITTKGQKNIITRRRPVVNLGG
jgi:hypothetical protein